MGDFVVGERVERRLAAVLAADVAGYSRLMGADEVGTARTLREHRAVTDALVAKHGGRIVKTTGDGVLLELWSMRSNVRSRGRLQWRNATTASPRTSVCCTGSASTSGTS